MSPRAVVLAGQRPGPDPLCDAAGVAWKADLVIEGLSMLERVERALRGAGISDITLSGYGGSDSVLPNVPGGEGPADSALLACEGGPFPVLLTTCDHPLLSPDMIGSFQDGATDADADFCVGLATEAVIQAAHPHTSRTYLRFSDFAVSGCNLFLIRNARGLEALRFWRTAQAFRKQPLKLARMVGLRLGARFAAGRLGLFEAFEAAGDKLGISAAPVLLPQAEAAIDVDKPADLELVTRILQERG